MSDIPIGSPPAPPGRHAAPSGWYPDPVDPRSERYWDGWQWGRDTRPGSAGAPLPAAQVPPAGWPGPAQSGYPPAAPAYRPTSTKPTTTPDGVPLAGWGWRALAAVLDAIFVGVLTILPAIPLLRQVSVRFVAYFSAAVEAAQAGRPAPTYAPEALITMPEQLAMTGILFGVGLAYHALFLRFARATPGKLIAGLRVVPVGRGRFTGPLPWGPAVLRGLLWVVPQLWLCLLPYLILDCLYPLWQPNRQAVHDRAARTQVVRVRT